MKDLPFLLAWSALLIPLLAICFIVGSDHLLPRVCAYWNARRWSESPLPEPTGRQKTLYGVLMAAAYCGTVLTFAAMAPHGDRLERFLPDPVLFLLFISPLSILFVLPASFVTLLFHTRYSRALLVHLSMIACAAAVMLSIAVPIATAYFVGRLGTVIVKEMFLVDRA